MAPGTLPFQGPTTAAISNAIINQPPPPPSHFKRGLSPKLEEIISKALEKSRDLRCQSAAEVNADLKRLRRELESATTVRAAVAAHPPVRGRRALWAVVLILAVFFAGYVLRKGFGGKAANPLSAAQLAQITTTEGLHEFPAWAPDGKRLVFSREVNGFKKLFVQALQGEPQQLTAGSVDDIQPKWTPDSQSIVFVRSNQPRGKGQPGDILRMYVAGC